MEIQIIISVSCNFLLSHEVSERALLLPDQSHHCQQRRVQALRDVANKIFQRCDGQRQCQTSYHGCLLALLLLSRAKSVQGFCWDHALGKGMSKVWKIRCQQARRSIFLKNFLSFLKFFLICVWGRKIWLFKEFLCKGGKCWSATARNSSEKRYRSYIKLPVEIIWSGCPERPAGILFHQRPMEASHSNVLKAVEN